MTAPGDSDSPRGQCQPPGTVAAPRDHGSPHALPAHRREMLCHILSWGHGWHHCPLTGTAPTQILLSQLTAELSTSCTSFWSWEHTRDRSNTCLCRGAGAASHRGEDGLARAQWHCGHAQQPSCSFLGMAGPSSSQDREQLLPQAPWKMLSCAVLRDWSQTGFTHFPLCSNQYICGFTSCWKWAFRKRSTMRKPKKSCPSNSPCTGKCV